MKTEEENKNLFLKYINILSSNKFPVGEIECQKLDLHSQEISFLVSHLNDFTQKLESSLERDQIIAKLCELTVGFGLVGILNSEDRDLNSDDFLYTAKNAEESFRNIEVFLNEFEHLKDYYKSQVLIHILLLCATHHADFPWSNECTVILSKECLVKLLSISKYKDLSTLLCDDYFHPTIFKCILKKIRPSLMKDTWLQYPSSCHIFSWFLHHVEHPYLADYLCDIFPPPCMFIEDHLLLHRVLAIKCFHHILDNVPPTLIKLNGKEEVIWTLLLPHTYSTEEKIIEILLPCMLKLPSFRSQKLSKICWSHYDEALNQLLLRTEMESTLRIKQIYLSHINNFIEITPPFKHLKRIMKIIEDCIYKDCDTACRIISANILREVIVSCWPSMHAYCTRIFKAVTFLLEEINNEVEEVKTQAKDVCQKCFIVLQSACPEEFKTLFTSYVKENSEKSDVKLLAAIFNKS